MPGLLQNDVLMIKHSSASSKTSRIKRKPVDSTLATSIGYDKAAAILEIEFQSGAVWQYEDVPEKVYKEMVLSSSIGSYFRDFIADIYPERRVRW